MRALLSWISVSTAAAALVLVPCRPAHACSRVAVPSVTNVTTLPLDGRGAPRNTSLWTVGSPDAGYALTDAQDAGVPFTLRAVALDGERPETLVIATPVSALAPGEYAFGRDGEARTHFTVVNETDTQAPPALTPTVTNVSGSYFGAYSCGAPSLATLTFGADAELAFVVPEDATWPVESALGLASGRTLQLAGLPPGPQRLRVLHVDLAGNATAGDAFEVNVPDGRSGCDATGALPVLALAALFLRRWRARH